MPKKKATPPQTEPKKPQVLALKKNTSTPALDAQVKTEAPLTPESETDPPVVSDLTPTPGAEVELPAAQPTSEVLTLTSEAEVKEDAPQTVNAEPVAPLTPAVKTNRPVLRKKSDRPVNAEASSETPTTPELLETPPDGALFQAVGVIAGDVTFNDEGKATVTIGGKEYPLF